MAIRGQRFGDGRERFLVVVGQQDGFAGTQASRNHVAHASHPDDGQHFSSHRRSQLALLLVGLRRYTSHRARYVGSPESSDDWWGRPLWRMAVSTNGALIVA